MQRELCDLVDGVTELKQAAGGFVAQVMKAKVRDAKHAASVGERRADGLWVVRKHALACARLTVDDGPRLGRRAELLAVAGCVPRVLHVVEECSAQIRSQCIPSQAREFALPARGGLRDQHA